MLPRRPLLWSFLCLAAGLTLPWAASGPAVLAVAGLRLLRGQAHGRRTAALCLAAGLLGVALASGAMPPPPRLATAPEASARHYLDRPVLARGVVTDRPRRDGGDWRAGLRLRGVGRARLRRPAGDDVLLFGPGEAPPWREGDRIAAWIILSRPRGDSNGSAPLPPPARLYGRLKSRLLVVSAMPGAPGPARLAGHLRAGARRRLEAALADRSAATRGLALALGLGIRSDLPPALVETMRRSGLAHVLAVSGLHLAALGGALAWLAVRIGLGRRGAGRAALLALLLFLVLVPGRPSVLRAVLMGAAPAIGRLGGRRTDPLNVLGGAGLLLLLARPEWVRDPGFILSFVVTAALLAHGGAGRGRLRDLLRMTCVASAASLPVTGWAFGSAALVGLAVNPLAVPLAGGLVALCMATTALSLVHPAVAAVPAALLGWGLELLQALAGAAARVPWGFLRVPRGRTALTVAAVALLMRRPGRGTAAAAWLGALAVLHVALLSGVAAPAALPAGRLVLRALDVGQGDALLVGLPAGETLLVDGGGRPGTDDDVGGRLVLPALVDSGVDRLAAVALSHPHHDHGDGLRRVLADMTVGELWLPRLDGADPLSADLVDLAVSRGVPVRVLRPGQWLERGGARIICLGPDAAGRHGRDPNRASLVLRIESRDGHLMLPGDIDRAGERAMLAAGFPMQAAVLKVAHHGSRTSTGPEWLRAVAPRVAVISAGASNPWSHPHGEVLARLEQAGVTVWRTDRHGQVTVILEGGQARVAGRRLTAP